MAKKNSFPLVGLALEPPVKTIKQRPRDLSTAKAKIKRVVEKATEAMVKVTGGVRDVKHLKSHMDYISRNGSIELENERGEILDTRAAIRDEHKLWSSELGKTRANEKHSIHIVLSMPKGTDPDHVRQAAREFARDTFGEKNQYLMALHHPGNDEKTKQPHVHLSVKARGYDGSRLDPRKDMLFEWRERFAEKMRDLNYNVEATPRRARGVIKKTVSAEVWQMRNDQERAGRSKTDAAKIKDSADFIQGRGGSENPYKNKIAQKQTAIRSDWLKGAEELEKSSLKEDKDLAKSIRRFVAEMPNVLKDERAQLRESMLAAVQERTKSQSKTLEQAPSKDKGVER